MEKENFPWILMPTLFPDIFPLEQSFSAGFSSQKQLGAH